MAHWQHRPEPGWDRFPFQQPYARGLARVREVLATTDLDPATLWQWGTMQARALIAVLESLEERLGAEGQDIVRRALHATGLDVGRQILAGAAWPEGMTEAEFASFYATVINRIVYASLEEPRIDSGDQVSFDIRFCPHQDHYSAFDCRVQRYFVQGLIDAARERFARFGFDVRFDSTMPAGAPTCHFTLWRPTAEERAAWEETTRQLEDRALARARRRADGGR